MFTHAEGVMNLFIGSHRHKLKCAGPCLIFQRRETLSTVIKMCGAAVTTHTNTPTHKMQHGWACCYSCAVLPRHDHADTLGQFVMDIRGVARSHARQSIQTANQSHCWFSIFKDFTCPCWEQKVMKKRLKMQGRTYYMQRGNMSVRKISFKSIRFMPHWFVFG